MAHVGRGFPGRDNGGGGFLKGTLPPPHPNFSPSSHSTQPQFTKSAFESNRFLLWARGSQALSDGGGAPISSTLSQTWPRAIGRHRGSSAWAWCPPHLDPCRPRVARAGSGAISRHQLQRGERKRVALGKQQAGASASRPPPPPRVMAGCRPDPEAGGGEHLRGGGPPGSKGVFRTHPPRPGPAQRDAKPGAEKGSPSGSRGGSAKPGDAYPAPGPKPRALHRLPYAGGSSAPPRGTLRPAAATAPYVLPPRAGNRSLARSASWCVKPRPPARAAQRTCPNGRAASAGGLRRPEGNPPPAPRRYVGLEAAGPPPAGASSPSRSLAPSQQLSACGMAQPRGSGGLRILPGRSRPGKAARRTGGPRPAPNTAASCVPERLGSLGSSFPFSAPSLRLRGCRQPSFAGGGGGAQMAQAMQGWGRLGGPEPSPRGPDRPPTSPVAELHLKALWVSAGPPCEEGSPLWQLPSRPSGPQPLAEAGQQASSWEGQGGRLSGMLTECGNGPAEGAGSAIFRPQKKQGSRRGLLGQPRRAAWARRCPFTSGADPEGLKGAAQRDGGGGWEKSGPQRQAPSPLPSQPAFLSQRDGGCLVPWNLPLYSARE